MSIPVKRALDYERHAHLRQKHIRIRKDEMTLWKESVLSGPGRGQRGLARRRGGGAFSAAVYAARNVVTKIPLAQNCRVRTSQCGSSAGTLERAPLITFPRAVFLKNLRWVMTASVLGRFRMVIFGGSDILM